MGLLGTQQTVFVYSHFGFCLFFLQAQKRSFKGPVIGVKVSKENKRNFTTEQLKQSEKIIGLQYGSNTGASQAGMGAYGTGRQIIPAGNYNEMINLYIG